MRHHRLVTAGLLASRNGFPRRLYDICWGQATKCIPYGGRSRSLETARSATNYDECKPNETVYNPEHIILTVDAAYLPNLRQDMINGHTPLPGTM